MEGKNQDNQIRRIDHLNQSIKSNDLEQNVSNIKAGPPVARPLNDKQLEAQGRPINPGRSNRKSVDDETIVKTNSIAYNTATLSKYLKNEEEIKAQRARQEQDQKSPLLAAEKTGAKIYKLVGYTTVGKINRAFEKEHRQRFLKKLLATAIIVLILLIGLIMINPFKSTLDIKRILGLNSKFNNEAYESYKQKEAETISLETSQVTGESHDEP